MRTKAGIGSMIIGVSVGCDVNTQQQQMKLKLNKPSEFATINSIQLQTTGKYIDLVSILKQ
jgi:hypothetical protein